MCTRSCTTHNTGSCTVHNVHIHKKINTTKDLADTYTLHAYATLTEKPGLGCLTLRVLTFPKIATLLLAIETHFHTFESHLKLHPSSVKSKTQELSQLNPDISLSIPFLQGR